jgi:hypothetical protein
MLYEGGNRQCGPTPSIGFCNELLLGSKYVKVELENKANSDYEIGNLDKAIGAILFSEIN